MTMPQRRSRILVMVESGFRPIDTNPAPPDDLKTHWVHYCSIIASPCKDYFFSSVVAHPAMPLMKSARLVNPRFMKGKVPTAAEVRIELQPLVGKLIDDDEVDNLVKQLADYQLSAMLYEPDGHMWNSEVDSIVKYWNSNKLALNHWYQLATKYFLLQPSSGCVERAFSILKFIYGKDKCSKIEQTVELELMLRYNNRAADCENIIKEKRVMEFPAVEPED